MRLEQLQERVPLAPLSTIGVGGSARWFARAMLSNDVLAAHAWAEAHGAPLFVLGGGSNLVISDSGFDGLVLQMCIGGVTADSHVLERCRDGAEDPSIGEALVVVGAGHRWDPLVELVVTGGFQGIECLSGIPGTVGGTPVQNVGAYGQEVASVIAWVDVVDRVDQQMVRIPAAECGFAYRTSRFKQQADERFVICYVAYRLRCGMPPTVTYPDIVDYLERQRIASPDVSAVRDAVLAIRRRKGMVIDEADPDTRSVGSFFMNPIVDRATLEQIAGSEGSAPHYMMDNDTVKIPAAWLIEQSGFGRGHTEGAVGLSTKHPLAIINRGGATARDVIRLARRIKRAVLDRFGIALRPEPIFVGFNNDPDVEYLRG